MNNAIIVVNRDPYCIWEVDIKERNREFIDSIDSGYFEYMAKMHSEQLGTKVDSKASIALKIAYYHGIETLFSLLGALIQAPDCVYAWIIKCSTPQLRDLVSRISQGDRSIFCRLNVEELTWHSISKYVFQTYAPGTEKNLATTKQFADLWKRLAVEFLDDQNINEYNSLKHGFRIKSGGFSLAMGREHEYGVAPPANEMVNLGESVHGTSILVLKKIGEESSKNRSYISRRISLNWSVDEIIILLQLISNSIHNVTSALKIINDVSPKSVTFLRPSDDVYFDRAWTIYTGVTSFGFNFEADDSLTKTTTKDELLRIIEEYQKHHNRLF